MGNLRKPVEKRAQTAMTYNPEVASLNMVSINFSLFPMLECFKEFEHPREEEHVENSRGHVFKNSYKGIEALLCGGSVKRARFEFECYDVRHMYRLAHFLDCGLFKGPVFVQTVFGILCGIGPHPEDRMLMRRMAVWRLVPVVYPGCRQGSYPAQNHCSGLGFVHVRWTKGLAVDSTWQTGAFQSKLVMRIRTVLEVLSLHIAKPVEARSLLDLNVYDQVAF